MEEFARIPSTAVVAPTTDGRTLRLRCVGKWAVLGGAGKQLEVAVTAADTWGGKVAVVLDSLSPASSAVLSTLEFIPTPAGPARGK
jgi:hypothetical protein